MANAADGLVCAAVGCRLIVLNKPFTRCYVRLQRPFWVSTPAGMVSDAGGSLLSSRGGLRATRRLAPLIPVDRKALTATKQTLRKEVSNWGTSFPRRRPMFGLVRRSRLAGEQGERRRRNGRAWSWGSLHDGLGEFFEDLCHRARTTLLPARPVNGPVRKSQPSARSSCHTTKSPAP